MKQSIKDWAFQKRDWILSEQIDQTELLTEEEYKEAMDRWKQMGVAENYKHQDQNTIHTQSEHNVAKTMCLKYGYQSDDCMAVSGLLK